MHSDLSQQERDEVMLKFKACQCDVLVATDIVARGIDIDDIQMVINYDVPHDCEDYVHRIGRTARADREGEAVTLVSDKDMYAFGQIEDFLEKDIEKIPLPGDLGDAPEYSKQRPNSPRHGKRGKGHGRRRSPAKGKTSAGKRGKSRSAKTSDKKKDNASREKIKE